ncbi:hypothetical protein INT48_008824 [Thamnidium elegans]|uniref:Uncharacterized protein n=1 Tax=Thamnidium elegans TaxID=101142 RepID=A0A8H7VT15_9FUNG|nr:hypothetical protein INT48_008824 [Thamnidium elegans]
MKSIQIDTQAFWRLVNQSGIEGYKKVVKKKKVGPKEKLPADFQEDIENGCNIWGVDPGVNTIITSVDTHVIKIEVQMLYAAESTGVKTSTNNENTYSPPAPSDNLETPGKTIIAFGDGAFSGNLRGHKAAPVRLIKKALNKYCGNNLEICMVDEYLTSQILHTILKRQQTTCNIVWNRDIMTAYNILDIFLFAAKSNNQRLDAFKRQNTTSEQSSV